MRIIILLLILLISLRAQNITFSECFNDDQNQLVTVDEFLNFTEAQASCELFSGNLVKLDSFEKVDVVLSLIPTEIIAFWVGMTRKIDSDPLDPFSYLFFDGTGFSLGAFGSNINEFPWFVDAPFNETESACLSFVNVDEENKGLGNGPCEIQSSTDLVYVCETSCDFEPTTQFPSSSPTTSFPTLSPTTSFPTLSPTTRFPTNGPTLKPTVPTAPPTTSPTKTPTKNPSKQPTVNPVNPVNPSTSPTQSPTEASAQVENEFDVGQVLIGVVIGVSVMLIGILVYVFTNRSLKKVAVAVEEEPSEAQLKT